MCIVYKEFSINSLKKFDTVERELSKHLSNINCFSSPIAY